MRSATSIMKGIRHTAAVKKRKEQIEQIKAANDGLQKRDIRNMLYILNLRRQMVALDPAELHALEIMKEAKTKKQRFCAIKRVKDIVYK